MSKKRAKTRDEIQSIGRQWVESSLDYMGSDIKAGRERGNEFYRGIIRDIPTKEDRSQVVSCDLQETVDGIMPDLMETLADSYGAFAPNTPEDTQTAEQATSAIYYTINKLNDGYTAIHDFVKTALIEKNGYLKCYVEQEGEEIVDCRYGQTLEQITMLAEDPEVLKIETTAAEPDENGPPPLPGDPPLYNCEITRKPKNRIVIMGVPPEEMLIERDARDIIDPNFICHWRWDMTRSDLISMGFDADEVDELPQTASSTMRDANLRRAGNVSQGITRSAPERALEYVDIYEVYAKIDIDGDGKAERVKLYLGGSGYNLLTNPDTGEDYAEVDSHPFISCCPYMVPYNHIGESLYDKIGEIQRIKTVIQRQTLDNMYNVNNQRTSANDRVNTEDLLENKVGGIVRVSGRDPVDGAIRSMEVQSISQFTVPLLEYWDTEKEARTFPRMNQSADPQAFNDTAFGINLLASKAQKGIIYIARTLAETGMKRLCERVLKLMTQYQQHPRQIRVNRQWMPIDPSQWDPNMAFEVDIGLGTATAQHRAAGLQSIIGLQMQAIGSLAPDNLPALSQMANAVRYSATLLVQALGFKNSDKFFPEIQAVSPPSDPPPDPAMEQIKAATEVQMKQIEMQGQIEQAKLQLEAQKNQSDAALKMRELDIKQFEAQTKAAAAMKPDQQEVRKGLDVPTQDDGAGEALMDMIGGINRSADVLRGSIAKMSSAVDAARPQEVQ